MALPTSGWIARLVLCVVAFASLWRQLAFVAFLEDAVMAVVTEADAAPPPSSRPKRKRLLPMFNETGGVIVFLHTAKTGGTTIRKEFGKRSNFPSVVVKRVISGKQLQETSGKIDWFLSKENQKNKTMLLEIHGEPVPVFQLHTYLHAWRSKAAAVEKNVFVFTLLREPISFFVSYFNFFRHPDCVMWCEKPLLNLTEENLVASLVPNHQCLYLARNQPRSISLQFPVSKEECESVYSLLQADVDWIGTTEGMQNATLPLLSYILLGSAEKGQSLEKMNVQMSSSQLYVSNLSAEAVQKTREQSEWDRYMYESAARDYRLDMFEPYVG